MAGKEISPIELAQRVVVFIADYGDDVTRIAALEIAKSLVAHEGMTKRDKRTEALRRRYGGYADDFRDGKNEVN